MGFLLEVENYRGLRNVRWAPDGVCALAGPNGSGKSTLLAMPDFLRMCLDRGGFGGAVKSTGGASRLKHDAAADKEPVRIKLELGDLVWEIRLVPAGLGVQMPVGETVVAHGLPILLQEEGSDHFTSGSSKYRSSSDSLMVRGPLLLPMTFLLLETTAELIRQFRTYADLEIRRLREQGSPVTSDLEVSDNGENLFSVLRNWRDRRDLMPRWSFVVEGLRECFPELIEDIDFETAGNTVALRFYKPGKAKPEPIYDAPNGLVVCLVHLAALASTPRGGIVAIDEVENSLHPYAIQRFIGEARRYARANELTVLLSTHSPTVLNEFNEDPSRVFIMEPGHETLPVRLTDHSNPEWLAQFALGDLYMNQDFGAQRPPPPSATTEQ